MRVMPRKVYNLMFLTISKEWILLLNINYCHVHVTVNYLQFIIISILSIYAINYDMTEYVLLFETKVLLL